MKKISCLIFWLILTTGCAAQKPIMIESPPSASGLPGNILVGHSRAAPPLFSDKFVLKVLNGLHDFVRLTAGREEIEINPGGIAEIPYQKGIRSRYTILTGEVITKFDKFGNPLPRNGEILRGTISQRLVVPARGDSRYNEDLWHITSFRKLRE
ncbi:MAG: hypothetical protein ABIF84_02330 [Patescibacteria group bacterium]